MTTKNAKYQSHTYKNGLRLITVPMKSTRTVTVLVMVRTGSRHETKRINGISHFLEHLMFKGTKKRPGALQISEELDSIGAEYNAFTSKEYTGYYVKCAADKMEVALDVISDIFQNSKFDPKEIDKERGAVKEEINMYFDTPMRYVGTLYESLMYGDQPLGWDIAGPKENIDRITREEMIEYFDTHYVAENTVISIAGNLDSENVKKRVKRYFDNTRERSVVHPKPFKEFQTKPGLHIFNKKTDQTHLTFGFKGYSRSHPKYEVMEVMAVLLGGGMSSRLFTEVREKRGLAYRVGAGTSSYEEVGDITTSAGLTNEKLVPAIEVIAIEHNKLKKEKVPEKELTKTKDYIRGKFVIGLEASDVQASYFADQELLDKKIMTPDEKLAKINAVTSEEIMEAAKELFVANRFNVALIGPHRVSDSAVKKAVKSAFS